MADFDPNAAPPLPDTRPAYAQGAPVDPTQGYPSLPQNPLPTPPSVQDSFTPPPNNPSPLKTLLTRFAYGAGQALLGHAGLPTDFEIQRQNFNQQLQQSQLELQQRAQQFNQQLVDIGNGIRIPRSAISAYIAGQSKENVANITGQYGLQKQGLANQGKADVANIQYGANIPLDPTVAQLAGIPQMAGKPVGKGMLGVINQQLQARGIKTQDLGSEGVYMIDRAGNRLARIGNSPAVDRASAFAYARAATTPFETIDEEGSPTTISNLQAIRSGSVGIGKPNLGQTLGKASLLGDIRGGIQQVKDNTKVLDDTGTRATIAAVLADPNGTPTKFIQSGVAGSLSPQAQDYVISLMNLREQAMAMRSVLGAGQGSEDLRRAIQATIPSAATPGSEYANKQLDNFSKTLDRLAKGIPNLGKATTNAASGETTTKGGARPTHIFIPGKGIVPIGNQ